MTRKTPTTSKPSQADKFEDAARELGADEDEKRWEERLKRVVSPKKQPEPERGNILRSKGAKAKPDDK